MNFPQFAFNNVKRNASAYMAYLFSSAFMVMIFFSYSVFIYHPQLKETLMGAMARSGMSIATYIVYVFSFFFVLYSIGVFIKSRNREFGILTILGAEAKQINGLIFLENMMIGTLSIVIGIVFGLLLSKLFLLICSKVMDIDELPFYWPGKAMLLTILCFGVLFFTISLFTLLFINKRKVLELLKGSSKPKQEPRTSARLALFGTVLLAIGFVSLHVGTLNPVSLIVAAFTGIAGTYFFYSQLSVWMIKRLQRSRQLTWKGINLLWMSEMSYKIKDNTRILFLVTVMTSLACMSVGFVLASKQTTEAAYKNNPFAISYTMNDSNHLNDELKEIDEQLKEAGLTFKQATIETIYNKISASEKSYLQLVSLQQYNQFALEMDAAPVTKLSDGEAMLVQSPEAEKKNADIQGTTIGIQRVNSVQTIALKQRTDAIANLTWAGRVLILPDQDYEAIKEEKSNNNNAVLPSIHYKTINEKGIPGQNDPETKVGETLTTWNKSLMDQGKTSNYLTARSETYFSKKNAMALFSFIGLFIALIFSFSSASFLYFKLHTELVVDGIMYRSLSKMGLSSKEMNTSATRQIALLFFIPIIVAAIQSLVVLGPVLNYIAIPYVRGPVFLATTAFLALQIIYFLIIRARYIQAVNHNMV
ncbi:ABC transporter permease [Paenibacillus alba]|uniref:ABC transporter permease n=1 Tax=Paenibacillus alba TaxID=1197127 RepID=A0ABU6GCU0_9BACL|nr:ABC transporter permease [Paenibacillus alba]MEC0232027.1 ABC transporter permease [Paenibacillus alba]